MSKTQLLLPKVKMTAAQRRKAIAVARDVVAQLRLKRIMAATGGYLIIDTSSTIDEDGACSLYENSEQSFQETLKTNKEMKCEVCAIGAAYIGYINKFNNVTNGEALNAEYEDMINTLTEVFQEEQLHLMEAVFEGYWVHGKPDWYMDLDEDAEEFEAPNQDRIDNAISYFHNKYADENQLLRAIMLNVIRNNGEFRLPNRVR